MMYAYNQTCPTNSEISSFCLVPQPFIAPTSFSSAIDSSQPYFACTDFNQFTCVPEICQLYAASRELEKVSNGCKMVDSKIRRVFPRYTELSFFNPSTSDDFNTAVELLRKTKHDKGAFSKMAELYHKAVDQAWNCLADSKAYSNPTKHMATVKVVRGLQQPEKLFSTAENMIANSDNMNKIADLYEYSFNNNRDRTSQLIAVCVAVIALCALSLWAKKPTPI